MVGCQKKWKLEGGTKTAGEVAFIGGGGKQKFERNLEMKTHGRNVNRIRRQGWGEGSL